MNICLSDLASMEVEKSILELTGVVESLGLDQDSLEIVVLHLQDILRTPQSFPPPALCYETLAPGYQDVQALLVQTEGDVQMLESRLVLLLGEKILRLSGDGNTIVKTVGIL